MFGYPSPPHTDVTSLFIRWLSQLMNNELITLIPVRVLMIDVDPIILVSNVGV